MKPQPQVRMKFITLDPLLNRPNGHHYNMCLAVGGELKKRGIEGEVLAHKECPQFFRDSLDCVPFFDYKRILLSKDQFSGAYENFHGLNNTFYRADKISIKGLKNLSPGISLEVLVKHGDGNEDRFKVNHTLSNLQIEWFKAGSALNLIADQNN